MHGWLVARVYGTGFVIYEGFFTYTPGTSRYEPLAPPVRVPRMWGMERDPRASLGRRRARGDGLVMVFWACVRQPRRAACSRAARRRASGDSISSAGDVFEAGPKRSPHTAHTWECGERLGQALGARSVAEKLSPPKKV